MKPLICILWLSGFVLTAFAQSPSGSALRPAPAPVPRSAAAPATRQITDAAGRIVTLPSTVNRVADPWPANNAMVLMLGGADKLVATSLQARNQPWLRRLYPPIAPVPAAFAAVDGYHVPVVMMPNSSLDGLKTTVRMTGEVLGEHESQVAAEYIRYFEDNIRRITQVTRKLPKTDRPRD